MAQIDTLPIDQEEINFGALNGDQPTGVVQAANYTLEFVANGQGTLPGSLFIWDFGDPFRSTITNPNIVKVNNNLTPVTHTYAITGRYVVRFIEQRKDGIILETVRTLNVTVTE